MFSTFTSLSSIFLKTTGSLIGTNWQKITTSAIGYGSFLLATNGNQNGTICEMDLTGQYILLIAQSAAKVFVSNNFGVSWTSVTSGNGMPSTMTPSGCAVSSDGQIMYVAHAGGSVYKSTNAGVSWSATGAPAIAYFSLSCSADGQKVLTGSAAANTPMRYSTNGGTSFTSVGGGLFSGSWQSYSISPDGTKLMAAGDGGIYLSTNDGANWTLVRSSPGNMIFGQIIVANNGNAVVVHIDINVPNSVYIYDGTSWVGVSSVIPNDRTRLCAASNDLKVILVPQVTTGGNGYLYLTLDYGATWKKVTSMPLSSYACAGVSGNGTYICAAGSTTNAMQDLWQSFN